ncbi:wax ester/triacylglycerol synthase family O-acyltransferase [Chitinimonas arctica]|uniref:diacylglycerol O-acyltransferase n=1 Tax=Chitinimonas arctica TaxID=2594795 RepID=A0A516SJW8_9NEIS|nr:wax ester/triacylglycerol synthase family O-acyltransferase [Chitinimonas arctica]QDQ28451.1 wax ester/triacylglycerol synthase family O-acyltransferase [Chitinimonas arctica]
MLMNLFGSGRESMSAVDTAWLRMDRPTNLMVITGMMFFEGEIDFERLRVVMEQRLLKHARFKQKVVRTGTNAAWEDDPDFDIANHLHRVALPGKAGKPELETMVNDLISVPMDFSKPVWQFYVVENYQGGSVLVARIHHCIADGIALIQVLLGLTDKEEEPHQKAAPKKSKFLADEREPDDPFMRLYRPVAKMYAGVLKSYGKLLGTSYGLMANPGKLAEYTQTGLGLGQGIARLAAMPADPRTKFKGKLSTVKRIAWSESLPLPEVKHVGKALGCSINDVLLSCVAGALRGYLIERGQQVDGLTIRASVPVNLRPESKLDKLGNYFGLVFLPLPIGVANPIERVYEVKRRMEEIKGGYDAIITLGLLSVVGSLPNMIEQPAIEYFSTKSTAVMTNVPGPREPIYLAGAKVHDLQFWVPQSGEIGMGVSILSYNDRVNFGVMTDKKLVPDPSRIIEGFGAEFEKLVLATLLSVLDCPPDPEMAELHLAVLRMQSAS